MKKMIEKTIAELLIDDLSTNMYTKNSTKMLVEISRLEQIGDINSLKKAIIDFKSTYANSIKWNPLTIIATTKEENILKEIDSEIFKLDVYDFVVTINENPGENEIGGYITTVVELPEIKRIIHNKLKELNS